MDSWLVGIFVACTSWWVSTGAIIWAVNQADRATNGAHRVLCLASVPLFILGAAFLAIARSDQSAGGQYLAFFGALMVWGWIEISLLTGTITGPNKGPCPNGLTGWARFKTAFQTVAYHDIGLFLCLIAITIAHLGATNITGLAAFAVLFAARVMAQLNLYLGVQRVHVEFLPKPVRHLATYFTKGRVTGFYAASVTILSIAFGWSLAQIVATQSLGYVLVGTLIFLALLEHLFMVVPLPDQKLWAWVLPKNKTKTTSLGEEANGL